MKTGEQIRVDNPMYFPDPSEIESTEEPYIKASIHHSGALRSASVMELCQERRGENTLFKYLAQGRVELTYGPCLSAEVLFDFYDRLEERRPRATRSFDYEIREYRASRIWCKVDILVNGEPVDALAQLAHRAPGPHPRSLHASCTEKLADTIPKQQFKIAIQGVDRRQGHRAHHHQRPAQGRHRQVLRR